MFGGFDPKEQKHQFLERRRGVSLVAAVALYGGVIVGFQYLPEPKEVEEEVVENVEIAPQPEPEEEPPEDLEIEEEPEPEEPPPPPPPNAKPRPKNQPPKPAPKVETPQEVTDQELEESSEAKKDQAGGGYSTGDPKKSGTGTKPDAEPKAPAKPEEPKVEKKPPKRDTNKPTTLTRDDKPAKLDPSNPQPNYPSAMQKRGIEGMVIVKLTIDKQARLRKLKFTRVQNNATKSSDEEKANEVMKKEVAKALSRWKFLEPCRHPDGEAFTCVMTQRFPFKLKK